MMRPYAPGHNRPARRLLVGGFYRMMRELNDLRQRLPEPGVGVPGGLRDELPPHY